jgi:serine/threonine-protein kinase
MSSISEGSPPERASEPAGADRPSRITLSPAHRIERPRDDAPELDTPVLAGRYRILEYLDSGGTADIFTALDEKTGGRVAVKVLNPRAAADARLRHYFLQGARGAQRVSHPNLLRVLEVFEPASGPPFAIMEIIDGKAVSTLIADHRTLAPEQAIELALQAAAGLEAAHRASVIHLDVKPENLLVEQPHPGEQRLKVIDFDLAAIAPETEVHEHPLLRGTAKYMAPEQVVGDPVDARTDVYSLGVVLFRMLTGHLPFDLELSPTLLWHQLASPAPPPSWLCDTPDPRLDAVVLKAMRKAPENRYASMTELSADLRALRTGAPLIAEQSKPERDEYLPRSETARRAARAIARCV